MVQAQHRLLTEHLNIKHLKLVIGQSMGGMHAWMWGEMYPDFVSALVPMAAQPVQMSGRNWMLRRMLMDIIRADPAYDNGNYKEQPPSLKLARRSSAWRPAAATRTCRSRRRRASRPTRWWKPGWRSALAPTPTITSTPTRRRATMIPAPDLEKITARVLAINAADDERNPPELGILAREIKRVKNGRYYEIPASADTRGHGTTGDAKFWKHLLPGLLSDATLAGK